MFRVTTVVQVSPELVFEQWIDFSRMPERIPDILKIEMLTEGPIQVGSKVRETRKMFGKETTETFEVTELEPNKRFVLMVNSNGVLYLAEHRIFVGPEGTRLQLEMKAEAQTFFAKLMTPMAWLMKGMMKKMIQKDLDHFAASLKPAE